MATSKRPRIILAAVISSLAVGWSNAAFSRETILHGGKSSRSRDGRCAAMHVRVPSLSSAAIRGGGSTCKPIAINLSPATIDRRTRPSTTELHSLIPALRGGGGGVGGGMTMLKDAIPPSATLAKAWAGLALVNGSLLAVVPTFASRLFGADAEGGTFERYLMEATGCVLLGHSVNLYLATNVPGMPVERSIGFGLLLRLLFLFKSFLLRTYVDLKAQTKFLAVNTAIMSWCTLSLLTGVGNPKLASRMFTSMALVKSSLLFFRPALGAEKFFGIDVGTDDMAQSKTMCKSLGFNLLINGVLMAALAFGVAPARAVGLSALTWSILAMEMQFISKTYEGLDRSVGATVFSLIVPVVLSLGCLA